MTTEHQHRIEQTRQAALLAVTTFESLPVGDAFAPMEAAAAASVAELSGHAHAALFPQTIARVDPAVFAMAEFVLEADEPLDAVVVDAHARALQAYPDFAAFLRTPIVMARVRAHAVRRALRAGHRTDHESVGDTVRAVEAAVAAQLTEKPEFEPAASVLSTDVPALKQRIAASRAQREDFARAEAQRLTADREAAGRAIQRAEIDLRHELGSFFAARGGRVFNLPNGRVVLGTALAAFAAGTQAYDIQGDPTPPADLPTLEQLRTETEAAEATHQARR